MTESFLRWCTWLCLFALAVLSEMPASHMVRTPASGWLEHVAAYSGTAFIAACAYRTRCSLPAIAGALVGYAALLEILQTWSPGRTPSATDLFASSAGIVIGTLAAAVAGRRAPRR